MLLCDLCSNVLKTQSSLNRHKREVHNLKVFTKSRPPFRCLECPLTFNSKTLLSEHFKCHTGNESDQLANKENEKSELCSFCGSSFANKSNLQRHIRQKHEENEDVIFAECGVTFKSKNALISHIQRHTDDRMKDEVLLQHKQLLENLPSTYEYDIHPMKQSLVSEFSFEISSVDECKNWISEFELNNKLIIRIGKVRKSKSD